jgi:HK97 family phage portal protein
MWKWLNVFKKARPEVDTPRRGFSISAGIPVHEDSAMQVSSFYRGVIYISTQIAKLPWNIKDKKNKIIEDNIAYLLDVQPNPEMNSFMFRLCMVQNAIIHGNAYAEIERDLLGRPKAIWPIPTQDLELYRLPEGGLIYRIVYSTANASNKEIYLPYNDVFHLRNFHTKDGLTGQGVVAYGQDTLGISLGANQMASNLFANGGLPSGVLSVKGTLSDEAYERVKKSWKEAHTGRKSAGIAVLEEGATWTAASMSPDILQFLESRKFSVLEVARFLGLPPTKLYDVTAATYSNQEQSNLEVATDTLDSWARNLESEADIKILNKRYGGRKSELDLYAIFRGDMTTRANYFSKMMQTAAITPNEIRDREGLAPYEDGDRYYVAVNNFFPADRVDEYVDAQVTKPEPKEESKPEPKEVEEPEDDSEKELVAEAIRFLKRT